MDFFTKHITTRRIIRILETALFIKDIEVATFKDIPDMVFIDFNLNNRNLKMIVHQNEERFSFAGTYIKVQINTNKGHSYVKKDEDHFLKVIHSISDVVGGLIIGPEDDVYEAINPAGLENSDFIYEEIKNLNVDEEELASYLESFLEKKKKIKNSNC